MEDKYLHLLIAVRRKKENLDMKELCFREVVRNDERSFEDFESKIRNYQGVWRIYITVNKRCVETARKLLMHKLIEDPIKHQNKIGSLWKSCLLQKECKADNKFLIDIDTTDGYILRKIKNDLAYANIEIDSEAHTPNGFHIVTEKFDTRMFADLDYVEIKRDAYKLLMVMTNNDRG